ncbi:MAG: UbiA family prenyltransferase [Anaerolineaceae bacterium]|nr:UbiA family prenyltransferase [Anaerolineaceae bacterium]
MNEARLHRRVPLRDKIRGAMQILRPELPAAAGMCVVIGEVVALGSLPSLADVALGFLCGFWLSASALVTNDYFDLAVDRINAPQRPLPSGLLTGTEAMILGLLTGLAGLFAAWAFYPPAAGISLVVWVLGFVYNWKLKSAGLWGNLVVCASVAMTFLLGGIGVGQAWNPLVWIFALIAFFFDLAEEIAGDAMDAAGDKQRGSRSIAIQFGRSAALRLSAILFGLVVVLSFLPAVWGQFGLAYLLPILLMDVLIVVFTVRLLQSRTPEQGRRAMRVLYIGASLGLLAFLIAALIV